MFVTTQAASTMMCPHQSSTPARPRLRDRVAAFLLMEPAPAVGNKCWSCTGPRCMAWRWHRKPVLERAERINIVEAAERPGYTRTALELLCERAGLGATMAPYCDSEEAQGVKPWTVIATILQHLDAWRDQLAAAVQPPAGWSVDCIDIVGDESEHFACIELRFKRDTDPHADGYCGHVPFPVLSTEA